MRKDRSRRIDDVPNTGKVTRRQRQMIDAKGQKIDEDSKQKTEDIKQMVEYRRDIRAVEN